MPYIFAKVWFPNNKLMDVVAKVPAAIKVLQKGKSEELVDPIIQNAVRNEGDVIVSFSIDQTKPGKLEAALSLARRYWLQYANIPGFAVEMKVYATAEEAFGTIDMKPPEI